MGVKLRCDVVNREGRRQFIKLRFNCSLLFRAPVRENVCNINKMMIGERRGCLDTEHNTVQISLVICIRAYHRPVFRSRDLY